MAAAVSAVAILFHPQAAIAGGIPDSIRGDGTITLSRPLKEERITVRYRDGDGNYIDDALDSIAHIFRCRLTEEAHPIDPALVEILDAIEDHFDAPEITLISAYRSPERNELMRKNGGRVAKRSLHMDGRAADIEVPGVSKTALRNFAYSLKQGGVGYYGRLPFVHVDTGPVRAWGFAPGAPATRSRPATANK